MKTIPLGTQGLTVSELGYGCMGLTTAYGPKLADADIVALLKKVHDLGVTFWDTANIYLFLEPMRLFRLQSPLVCQEEIIADALEAVGRQNVVVSTKTGLQIKVFPSVSVTPDGSPAFIRRECEASLRRLRTDYIDLLSLHRIDPNIPIEITITEMKKLVEEGKVRYIGLSECSAATIRRAHAVHPITAVQLEYSLWARGIEAEVMETCKELGIGVVAYSPLGRGFFGGASSFVKGDYRLGQERMAGEAGEKNAKLLEKVAQIATDKDVSSAQLALAWVKAQQHRVDGAGVVAIPGTTKAKNLESNVASVDIELSPDEIAALEAAVPPEEVEGARYSAGSHIWETDNNRALTKEEAEQLGIEQES